MSASPGDRSSVVNLGAWREERSAVDAARSELEELRRQLDKERAALAESRRLLEQERAAFEDDLSVLEEQRHYLDGQRDKLRQEIHDLEAMREDALKEQAAMVARAAQKMRVDAALHDSREALEAQRAKLRAEMAATMRAAPAKADCATPA